MSYLVEVTARGVTTDSRTVAEVFEKEHKNVLRDIDALVEKRPDLLGLNFEPKLMEVPTNGRGQRQVRAFEMDRDGFTLLAMGFTGEKALDWKIAYIEAFNRMEAELAQRANEGDAEDDWESYHSALIIFREYRKGCGSPKAMKMWDRLGLPKPEDLSQRCELDEDFTPPESVAAWLRERTRPDSGGSESATALYSSYATYCELEGYGAENQCRFGRALQRMGYFARKGTNGWVRRHGLSLLN